MVIDLLLVILSYHINTDYVMIYIFLFNLFLFNLMLYIFIYYEEFFLLYFFLNNLNFFKN